MRSLFSLIPIATANGLNTLFNRIKPCLRLVTSYDKSARPWLRVRALVRHQDGNGHAFQQLTRNPAEQHFAGA
jgi:hypothetical protein